MLLDRKKPYGAVMGQPGVKFEQDGKPFNAKGEEVRILPNGMVELVDPPKEKPRPEKPKKRVGRPPKKEPEVELDIKPDDIEVTFIPDEKPPEEHICSVCGYRAQTRFGLLSHVRKHKGQGA